MIKFTKEEICLCKQIYRKHGEILDTKWKPSSLSWEEHAKIIEDEREMQSWTISDCLEFLREKCQDHVFLSHDEDDDEEWYLWMDEYKETQQMGKGKTPLEACLKAILAVLGE